MFPGRYLLKVREMRPLERKIYFSLYDLPYWFIGHHQHSTAMYIDNQEF